MAPTVPRGIVNITSRLGFDQTVAAIKTRLAERGVRLFAQIDHSGEAAKVGMAMRPTELLIFGRPEAGTPLMLASPSVAIDLPLKVLVWEDADNRVWMSYNTTAYLKERHDLPDSLLGALASVETLVASIK
jgi:uncharacterized protein (DUF302 family)